MLAPILAVAVIGGLIGAMALSAPTPTAREATPSPSLPPQGVSGTSRGYLTTPGELEEIARRAGTGEEPYAAAVRSLLEEAQVEWDYRLRAVESCQSSDDPEWIDDSGGAAQVYARALAYHLTGEERYAAEVRDILERVMRTVEEIETDDQQCRLNFAWGTPELVAAADLIEAYWEGQTCSGPESTRNGDGGTVEGDCKDLFQNWLVKNPYYVVSLSGLGSQSNWGAAATTTMATIADYLWDRPDVVLVHRQPVGNDDDEWDDESATAAEAYRQANELAIERMNGHRVELYSSESCDYLRGDQQDPRWAPVKSQITETGILPEDARRDESCNIPKYNGEYQNYPQIHIGNLIQHCELMLRRGDASCYDNVDDVARPNYTFTDPDGVEVTTQLHAGRGSLERAINAVIVDSGTEWRRPSALAVAYRYYRDHQTLGEVDAWRPYLQPGASSAQDLSFGNVTHALADGDRAPVPPSVAPPADS
jgi:hypothetical protein